MRYVSMQLSNIFITLSFVTVFLGAKSQITTTTMTPTQLVQNVLLGPGVTAMNITYTGVAKGMASFTATPSSSLGIAKGVYLTTGSNGTVAGELGPSGPSSGFQSISQTNNNNNEDADLSAIAGIDVHDPAILEFDFIPQSDTVRFRYVFGSEEYNDFVNSINDVFAYILSGVTTPLTATNIALIPGTSTPITINNVNNGNSPGVSAGPCNHCAYYRDNINGSIDCVYDGLTVVLTAKHSVICGETYHIKIAIADAADHVYDSGVFLEAGSFSSAPPITVSSSSSNGAFADTLMYEGCNSNCLYLVRTGNTAVKDSFQLSVAGNAINGTDYQQNGAAVNWPTKLIYNANQDTIIFCGLKAIEDNVAEGTDTIRFSISTYTNSAAACISSNTIKFNLYIRDYVKVSIGQGDTTICNGQSVVLNANASHGVPAYTYTWQPGSGNGSSISTGPISQPTTYTITVKDICFERPPETKTVTVTPSTLPMLADLGNFKFCLDSVKKIQVVATNGKPPYQINWIIPGGGVPPFDTTGMLYSFMSSGLPSDGTYTVVLTDQCNKQDTITTQLTIIDCDIKVPNVVTPNGDNVNEAFKIHGLENFPNSSLYVYNRWGRKLYQSSNYANDWKPDYSAGTYFYVLELPDGRKFNGFFEIFKN